MIERAVLREVVVDRATGESVSREYQRPDVVRAMPTRIRAWRSSPEFCHRCGTAASAVSDARPVCHGCRVQVAERRMADRSVLGSVVSQPTHRDVTDAEAMIGGYPIIFNSRSVDLGGFKEVIRPQSIRHAIESGEDMRALVDHDSSKIMGRKSAGTLTFKADAHGLRVRIDPPRASYARDIIDSLHRRDVTGGSFGFQVLDDEWYEDDGVVMRDVWSMRVSEISIVTFPAYPDTDMRAGDIPPLRSVEHLRRLHRQRMVG